MVAFLVLTFWPVAVAADADGMNCTRCYTGCCQPNNWSTNKQCVARTDCTWCRSWDACVGPLGPAETCGLPDTPPCEPTCRETQPAWRLASVVVRPAREPRATWTLTHVRIDSAAVSAR